MWVLVITMIGFAAPQGPPPGPFVELQDCANAGAAYVGRAMHLRVPNQRHAYRIDCLEQLPIERPPPPVLEPPRNSYGSPM